MEQDKKCVVCQATLKFVPHGVSRKTGKPYNEFWACPEGHKQTKQNADTQMIIDVLIGMDKKIDRIHERLDGLGIFLKNKFQ